MSTNAPPAQESAGTTTETDAQPTIDGPIPELDKYGSYTGARYFRCRRCGREAMRRRDLETTSCNGGHL